MTEPHNRSSADSQSALAIMARVKSIGVHAKHDARNTYVVSLTFEGDDQPTIKQFQALKDAALSGDAAQAAKVRLATIEECAKLVEPKQPRPCDCERCDCGNRGDMEAVASWDTDAYNAKAIRALAEPVDRYDEAMAAIDACIGPAHNGSSAATEDADLLGEMKHGHAEPVANRHYAWAVAEITQLRQKVSKSIDEASFADLRASGGIEPQALLETQAAQVPSEPQRSGNDDLRDLAERLFTDAHRDDLPQGVRFRLKQASEVVRERSAATSGLGKSDMLELSKRIENGLKDDNGDFFAPPLSRKQWWMIASSLDYAARFNTLNEPQRDVAKWPDTLRFDDRDKYIDELEDQIERLRAVPQTAGVWQPIETAPRDGSRIVVGRDMGTWGFVRGIARWEDIRGISGWVTTAAFSDPPGVLGLAEPTHWLVASAVTHPEHNATNIT